MAAVLANVLKSPVARKTAMDIVSSSGNIATDMLSNNNTNKDKSNKKNEKIDDLITSGSTGPLHETFHHYATKSDVKKEMEIINKQKSEVKEALDILEKQIKEQQAQQMLEKDKNLKNNQEDRKNAQQNLLKAREDTLKLMNSIGSAAGYFLNGIGDAFKSTVSASGQGLGMVGNVGAYAGNKASGALSKTADAGIALSKPFPWFIVAVLLLILIVLLLVGGLASLSRSGSSSSSGSSSCNDISKIEFNNFDKYFTQGQSKNENLNMPQIQKPTFNKYSPSFSFNFDFFKNYLSTTEPFAKGMNYLNILSNVIEGKSVSTFDRIEEKYGRYDNIMAIKDNNNIVNVLKPKPILWELNEYEHADLQNLPQDYKTKLNKLYTVSIPWEKNNNLYTVSCNNIKANNVPINILSDKDSKVCTIAKNNPSPIYS